MAKVRQTIKKTRVKKKDKNAEYCTCPTCGGTGKVKKK